jgi:tetratricopeptide (TPR) repeat protein
VRPENLLSDEQRRQLAALGYLGALGGGATGGGAGSPAATAVSADLPDPRRMTAVARDLHEAARRVEAGRCDEALPSLQGIVRRDPHNFPALTLAGLCLKEAGKLGPALALFEQASRENELSAVPAANAAGALAELGRRDEAEREYRHALALDPTLPEAAANLARLLRERNATAEAVAVLAAALDAGAHDPSIFLERGLARAEAGEMATALADFREAARASPSDPAPLENAARAAYHLGRHREAADLYEQLLRLAPERGDLWKTLGAVYLHDLGSGDQALAAFRRALALEADPAERARLQELVGKLGG